MTGGIRLRTEEHSAEIHSSPRVQTESQGVGNIKIKSRWDGRGHDCVVYQSTSALGWRAGNKEGKGQSKRIHLVVVVVLNTNARTSFSPSSLFGLLYTVNTPSMWVGGVVWEVWEGDWEKKTQFP